MGKQNTPNSVSACHQQHPASLCIHYRISHSFISMTWSPNYKQNRFYVVNHMKIKDYQNYDALREYYGVLNGQNPNTGISPRAPTFSGLANSTKISDNIKTQRGKLAPSTPLPRGPNPATAKGASKQLQLEPKVPVGFSANLQGKCFFAQNFTRAFASSYTIPAAK